MNNDDGRLIDYKEEVIRLSEEKLKGLRFELMRLDQRRGALTAEVKSVESVLRQLGATRPEPAKPSESERKSRGSVTVQFGSQTRFIELAIVDRIRAESKVLTTQALDALVGKGKEGARPYIAYLQQNGLMVKLGKRGRYQIVKPLLQQPLPPEKDRVIEDGPGLRVIDGIVTTEKPPERGYGT